MRHRSPQPERWPPNLGYQEALDGWQVSAQCPEWLHKPSNGVFFHTPTESLWRRARGDRRAFVRVQGLDAVTIAAFGDTAGGRQVLLRACLLAWRRQVTKFEDMDADIAECCNAEARDRCPGSAGRCYRPRDSARRLSERGDATLAEQLWPVLLRFRSTRSLSEAPSSRFSEHLWPALQQFIDREGRSSSAAPSLGNNPSDGPDDDGEGSSEDDGAWASSREASRGAVGRARSAELRRLAARGPAKRR